MKRVIAIDPGYDRVGIALLDGDQSYQEIIHSECFVPKKSNDIFRRIFELSERIDLLIKQYQPQFFTIEDLFFSKNTKTALKVAEVRGSVMYIAQKNNLPIREFTPNQIKVAVAGHGSASKRDIFLMLPHLIDLPKKERLDDELDAIALGITFLVSSER